MRLLCSDSPPVRLQERQHRAAQASGPTSPGILVLLYFTFSDLQDLNMHQEVHSKNQTLSLLIPYVSLTNKESDIPVVATGLL